MDTGIVKFFNTTKWFGFITPDNGEKDVFVHSTQIEWGSLNEGDKVEYTVGQGQKGPQAEGVRLI